MTSKAKADVEESMEVIETLQDDLVELEQALAEEMDEIEERWEQIASQIETTIVMPYKKNIRVELFGIAWTPYWRVQVGQSVQDVPGFSGLNL
jgi:transcription elongation GreA/GreB family factor